MEIKKGYNYGQNAEDYFWNKATSCKIFGYALARAEFNEEEPSQYYLSKKDLNLTQMAADMKMGRATISKKWNELIDLGVVEEFPTSYKLHRSKSFVILPTETIEYLAIAVREEVYTVYLWLARNFERVNFNKENKGFVFTKGRVAIEALGLTDQTKNRKQIDIYLDILIKLGLIKVEQITEKNEEGIMVKRLKMISLNKNIEVNNNLKTSD